MDGTTDLVPSVSIEALVERRNAMAERIRQAHGLIVEVHKLGESLSDTYLSGSISLHFDTHRRWSFGDVHETHGPDDGADRMIKAVDASAWAFLMKESGLQTFMDAKTREEWNKKIQDDDVPELTFANIRATFSQLYAARGDMFEDGIVSFFKSQSWHYKTNQPVKLGKRMVRTRAVDVMRHWLSGPSHHFCNELDDLIRVMSVLDNKPEPDHRQGAWYTLNADDVRWMRDGSDTKVATLHGYVEVKGYKNGNAHLTFLRPDLVDRMNQIIAKRYPNALAPDRSDG